MTNLEVSLEGGNENVPQVYDLGFVKDYKLVWDFQKELLCKRIERNIPDSLILVEHDHVITLGRSSHLENIMIRDLPIFEIERGGDVTYHGPGQLVAYPIVSLQEKNLSVRQFVELLEASIIDVITELGIKNAEGKLGQATGVWIDNKRKIASIGVAVSHWVTYHGIALNVNTDLSFFQKIRPCGFDSTIMTSLSKELQVERIDINKVKLGLADSFSRRLNGSQGPTV
ncbi:MAG: lipoyl(octanoyl) transferase LipB [archaeon]|nr:lipoyl(octanoyl) transferase LipB [archaeon]